jgi:hypothetical protein
MAEEKKEQAKNRPMNLQLQLEEEMAQGRYVNFAMVNHTHAEFVLDFVFMQPQQPRGKVLARVVTAPVHAKRLLMALSENLAKYEQRFGPIHVPAARPTDPIVH